MVPRDRDQVRAKRDKKFGKWAGIQSIHNLPWDLMASSLLTDNIPLAPSPARCHKSKKKIVLFLKCLSLSYYVRISSSLKKKK